jgi:hypothetical protein
LAGGEEEELLALRVLLLDLDAILKICTGRRRPLSLAPE